ncbi:Uncharacterised protein [uncultured archaeon]|nr:Uncharacterised protein [uncultured archaeon]
MNAEKLEGFLVEAKRNTYALGIKAKKIKEGLKEFTFKKGNFRYVDKYRGEKFFFGEETVFFGKKAVWFMDYAGGVKASAKNHKAVYSFLRKALALVDTKRPFRGPGRFTEGKFSYSNTSKRNANWFSGREIIKQSGRIVYSLDYVGCNLSE